MKKFIKLVLFTSLLISMWCCMVMVHEPSIRFNGLTLRNRLRIAWKYHWSDQFNMVMDVNHYKIGDLLSTGDLQLIVLDTCFSDSEDYEIFSIPQYTYIVTFTDKLIN
jgi:hypothetical protein